MTFEEMIVICAQLIRKLRRNPTVQELKAQGVTPKLYREKFGSVSELRKQTNDFFPSAIAGNLERAEVLRLYAFSVKSDGRVPNKDRLAAYWGITRNTVRWKFGDFDSMHAEAKKTFPEFFEDTDLLIHDIRAHSVPKAKRYVVTTAVAGARVNKPFLDTLRGYCEHMGAELLVLAVEDPAMSRGTRKGYAALDSELGGCTVVGTDLTLNSNLILRTLKTSAKMIDPTSGLKRLGHRGGSAIIGSPKQRLTVVPTIGKYPHVIMSTGAITLPEYTTDLYWSLRTAYLAENDHICGAVIVEIESDQIFHYRQVQADQNGSIVDLGVRYSPDGRHREDRPEAVVFGDIHAEYEEPGHRVNRFEIMQVLRPKRAYMHDVLDCGPITHHDKGRYISRASRDHVDLRVHLQAASKEINALAEVCEHVYVVRSNHDEALDRYLDEMRYRHDPQNFEIAHYLAGHLLQGNNPFESFYLERSSSIQENVTFLLRDEESKVEGIECGQHGDKGPNGSRGSPQNLETSYGPSFVGHSHQPNILRALWTVGTSSKLRMGYNAGPSGWMNTHGLVYKGGLRQMINVIDGKWRLEK